MKKNVKNNYIYNMIYQVVAIILPIITTPYLSRILGANGTGIYSYTISIVTYFILFGSFGLAMYGQREIAYVQNDVSKRSNLFYELVIFRLITLSISVIPFYLFFIRTGDYSVYYGILLLEILANALDITWFYQGLEEFKKISIRNLIIKFLSVLSIFLFIHDKNDIWIYILIYASSTLVGSISLWFGLWKYLTKPHQLKIIRHIKSILTLFIPQVAIQIYVVLDKTMIGSILHDMDEVGYYEQSQKIVKILLTLITAVGTVMMPRIASCFSDGNLEQIKRYMYKTFHFIFFLAFPFTFGVIACASDFSLLFFGNGFEKVPILMQIMSIIILLISISNVTGTQYLIATKKQKQFTVSVVIGAIVNFLLNIILIKQYKSTGAAIATVVAELSVTFVQLFFVRKIFDIKEIFKISFKYFVCGLIMFVVCVGIGFFMNSQLLTIIVQVVIGAIVYLTFLILLKDEFFMEIKNNIILKIKKVLKKVS